MPTAAAHSSRAPAPAVAVGVRRGNQRFDPRIRTMVVDDEVTSRGLVARALGAHPDVFVVATSAGLAHAVQTAARVPLDAIVLDTEMPGTDAIVALESMIARQAPGLSVVMSTAATTTGAGIALQALQQVDCLHLVAREQS